MGKIGYGYGSKWHLLRYLGYHRSYFSEQILQLIGGQRLEWLDFNFSKVNDTLKRDRELVGLDFIDDPNIQRQWHAFWPQSGSAQNWDAVGIISVDGREEWLLVETKAHIQEIRSSCGARSERSKSKIKALLEKSKNAFGGQNHSVDNWLSSYYQYANRLAVLYFLMNECDPPIPARLLSIYFYGDQRPNPACPQSPEDWEPTLREMDAWLGIDHRRSLFGRVHHLFLPVNPNVIFE